MSLTITLPPETEAWLQRQDAVGSPSWWGLHCPRKPKPGCNRSSSQEGIPPETLAARHLEEQYRLARIRDLQRPRPASEQARLDRLIDLLHRDALDPNERVELRRFTDENERLSGERLLHLLALSRLWNRPVPDIMVQLGIRPPDPV